MSGKTVLLQQCTISISNTGLMHRVCRALPPAEGPPVPNVQEARWAPKPVWSKRLEEKSFLLFQGSNLDRPVVQPVARHYTDWATRPTQKSKFEDNTPPGWFVHIWEMSTYVNNDTFFCLKDIFSLGNRYFSSQILLNRQRDRNKKTSLLTSPENTKVAKTRK
jgi:hypothetical protein